MLKVYEKTDKEFNEEVNLKSFYSRMVKWSPEPVCKFYVVKKDGAKKDVWDLDEKEIFSFITQAMMNEVIDKNVKDKVEIKEAIKLSQILEGHFKPSLTGLKSIIEMLNDNNPNVVSLSKDIFTPIVHQEISEIKTIAKFLQESNGNFERPTKQQLLEVVDQMEKNKKNKVLAEYKMKKDKQKQIIKEYNLCI